MILCFQHAAVAWAYEVIKWKQERVSNNNSFINNYNWERINYPLKIEHLKILEKNNPTIALNVLHIKEKEICQANI